METKSTFSAVKFGLGIAAFILAVFLGYHLFPTGTSSEQVPSRTSVVQTEVEARPVTRSDNVEADSVEEPQRSSVETADNSIGPETLKYLGWDTEDTGGSPQACLRFSESFQASNETELKTYFRVEPNTPFSLDAQARQICVLGLEYGQTYRVKALKGLSSDNGASLRLNATANIEFQDKPAFVGFAGSGIILPETQGAQLTIKTVNLDKIDLTVFRVNDRILSQYSPDKGEDGIEGSYSSTYAANGKRVEVFKDTLTIENIRNAVVETGFDLKDTIANLGAGAYIVIAERPATGNDDYYRAQALRWIISTDLALTSYRGSDGLHVAVRSIQSAALQAGIRLDLVAANNEQLAETVTDSQGRAKFSAAILNGKGPLTPKMVMAYGPDGDYAVLNLARAPLDLTEMDVGGKDISEGLNLYAFTDRGIYRPGETVHLTALLRDADAVAVKDRTVVLDVIKPDGVTEISLRLPPEDMAGGYSQAVQIPDSAARGRWTLKLSVEGTDYTVSEIISVEDFVPQRLKLTIAPEELPVMTADSRATLTLDAQFYYGAPGSNLETEGNVRVQRDPNPFPKFKDYSFGDVAETYQEQVFDLDVPLTNDDGRAEVELDLGDQNIAASSPLRASAVFGVAEPGGRFVRENIFVPIRTQDQYVGFNPRFDGRADRKAPAQIDLIALSQAGERIPSTVSWTLYEENYGYDWYRENGRWRYRGRKRDKYVDEGAIAISASAPALWSQRLDWGRYRLDTVGIDGEKASYRFGVGWSNSGDSDAPDRILVGATELPKTPGGSFVLNLNAPYAGQGDIVIADHRVRSIRTISIPEGASSVRIPYSADWGHSVYAMVTLYTPLDAAKRQTAKRAVGLTHIGLDRSPQTLNLAINTPTRVAPRESLEVPITVAGNMNGKAFVTLAAVDEGILALTKFKSPDAPDAFFSKSAFALDVHDDYARILNPFTDGSRRSGGDSIGGAGLTVVPTQTVALFKGPVTLRNGKATISLDLPDFNGELRLMATAWTQTSVGSASTPLVVRDAVPANLALPRFLAPGDRAVATLALDNIDGEAGTYRAETSALGLLDVTNTTFDLTPGTRDQAGVTINADGEGIYDVQTKISGPKDYAINSSYPIQVRSPYRPISRRVITPIDPGESHMLNASLLDGYNLQTANIDVGVSPLPGLNAAAYVNSLSRYPYGCTEQTVSSAMPLLFVEQLGGFDDISNVQLRDGIDGAIQKLASRQSASGAFGLWSQGDGNLVPWLQLYVTEFLIEADVAGFDVPEAVLTKAISSARAITKMDRYTNLELDFDLGDVSRSKQEIRRAERAAYGHFLLARAGQADASGLRYVHDNFGKNITDSLAHAYLGAGLATINDAKRAEVAYTRAVENLDEDKKHEYYYYSSRDRDVAGVLAVGGNTLPKAVAGQLLEEISDLEPRRTSTQERSYIVRAIAKMRAGDATPKFATKSFKGESAGLRGSDLTTGVTIKNNDSRRLYVTANIEATPTQAPKPISNGFSIEKTLYSLEGKALASGSLKQGDRVIILVESKHERRRDTMLVINDMLPAGLEIETLLTSSDGEQKNSDNGAYPFLGLLSDVDMQEARDDRYIASERISRWNWREGNRVRVAYIARAVTPGDFVFPGALVEDMYKPEQVGTSEVTRLEIAPSGSF